MVANAKSIMEIAMKTAPKLPSPVEKAEQIISGPPSPISTPLTKITKAVTVHKIIVSAKTSAMPQFPCVLGSLTRQLACTATVDPSPASFENAPRRNPMIHACFTAKPAPPPAADFNENAELKIWLNALLKRP